MNLPIGTERPTLGLSWLPLTAVLFVLAVAVLVPLGTLVVTALGGGPINAAAGLTNAAPAVRNLTELGIGPAVWTTIALATTYIAISLPIALVIAYLLGRTDLPGGDFDTLLASIRNVLFSYPDDTVVYAGHGEPTTIGREKRTNPFLK